MNYLIGLIFVLGMIGLATTFIPTQVSTTRVAHFDASIDEVWAVYTDVASQPGWRDEIATISFKDESKSAWVETLRSGGIEIHLSILESHAPNKLILKTASPGSFEGEYIALFEATEDGTKGTFTEVSTATGYVAKIIRFLFVDQENMIDTYSENARREILKRRN